MFSVSSRGIKTSLPPLALALSLGISFSTLAAPATQQATTISRPGAAMAAPQPPDVLLGPLFSDVQRAKLFPDQKTFADAVPNRNPAAILEAYTRQKPSPGFNLRRFVESNFTLPQEGEAYVPPAGQTLRQHIDGLWGVLTRTTRQVQAYDSLLPLPHSYVVPGGRFREIYYWDSYFTMLGLAESGNWTLVRNMTDNFAHEIDRYGHIPNGNRSYYLSRSQPPFFSFMVELLAQHQGDKVYAHYLPQLKKEYHYWMRGSVGLPNGQAGDRVVRLDDGSVLNRYWDERDTPRTESYMEDITTASQAADRPAAEVYRHLRAGAASGWDFSSRWLRDPRDLSTIHTTDIIPVDLNSLLFHLEQTLARGAEAAGNQGEAAHFLRVADERRQAVNRYLWNQQDGYYSDYDWRRKAITQPITAAAVFPLYVNIAPRDRAAATGEAVRKQLLKEGGLTTTTVNTGQQWDAPNGWAPLQWVAVEGFSRYGQDALAQAIGTRFLVNVQKLYDAEHKLVEKYVVEGAGFGSGGGGGEYTLQDGFGWSNGVTLKLMARYCDAVPACRREERSASGRDAAQ
ncbi:MULTISPECIES: alpha,alpha-trehalase TreA [Brenneria]|uniref:Periplasmic trehalase n=1 Tax=Brenneria nigrifluens DSM 30175 = ATCC 13028 TaxID=1121120 RepID=A0A2U1US18_9GAMM|nr:MULTISPECIES: alpha,alpha-trehalase TreA [Brenneria]EHD21055.1 Alpha,alpha-trehalase [Brenneria sp. EniD312]PWC24479.1 alpha,alpha-trehalase TreA [Brenneria nigrifluens DSM 30175 = ATCC 13028]QCR04207.1 alpha,alpha-trehalase TreA [Brenneria nigrifluens DSM 30175 = ATCC 13028]